MSITENVNLLAGRIAQEFNSVQSQISALSAGGGGGGMIGVAAPSYYGNFNINIAAANIAGGPLVTLTGPSSPFNWPEVFACPSNLGFQWSNSTSVVNGNTMMRNDGGIKILNAGKYRIRVNSTSSMTFGMTVDQLNFRHVILRNNVRVLQANNVGRFELTQAGGSTAHGAFFENSFEGIVELSVDDILCFGIQGGLNQINISQISNRLNIYIESVF